MGLGGWRGRRWQKAVSQTTYAHLRAATVAARAGESERSEGGWEGERKEFDVQWRLGTNLGLAERNSG